MPESKKYPPRSRGETPLEPVIANSSLVVAFEKTITRNLGDGNYVKISCRVELPYNPTRKDRQSAKEALDAAEIVVDTKLEQSLAEFLEE